MKYLLSIIFFLTTFTSVFSQNILDYKEYYVGTGYAVGIRSFSNTNEILERYNADTSRVQEKEFGDFKSPNGITFLVGTTLSFMNFEVGFTQLQQRKKTKYASGNNLNQRDVRLRINSYFIGAGMFFPVESNFGFGANVSFDLHRMKLSTRQAVEKSINRSSFITPSQNNSYGTTIQLKFYFGRMNDHGTKLLIAPYYSIVFQNLNGKEFDKTINDLDDSNATNQKMSHMGVKFVINYSVRK